MNNSNENKTQKSKSNSSAWVSSAGWLVAVLLTAAFVFLGRPYFENQAYQRGRVDQKNEDVSMLEKNGLVMPEVEINSLVGEILSIEDGLLTLKTEPLQFNPLKDDMPAVREVVIDDMTTFSEFKVQQGVAESDLSAGALPSQLIETPLTLADLKVGETVQVFAREDDISAKTKFVASKIQRNLGTELEYTGQPGYIEGGSVPYVNQ